jgi:translation initiation factor IF-2
MPEKSDNSSGKKKKVLDLIDDESGIKLSRRERQRKDAEVVVGPSELDKAKANALDLFTEDEKPKVKKTATKSKNVLGGISIQIL